MKCFFSPFTGAIAAIILSFTAQQAAGSERFYEQFAEANQLFENDDLSAAMANYQDLFQAGAVADELFINLGVTAERLDRPGEAALWFARAEVLEPQHPEAKQSLRFLENEHGFLHFEQKGAAAALSGIPRIWLWWGIHLSIWAVLLSIVLYFILRRQRKNRSGPAIIGALSLFLLLASGVCLYLLRNVPAPEALARVTAMEVEALATPEPEGKAVTALPPGSEIAILQDYVSWVYVQIPSGVRGWVEKESITPLLW